jgi:hypothetical protein
MQSIEHLEASIDYWELLGDNDMLEMYVSMLHAIGTQQEPMAWHDRAQFEMWRAEDTVKRQHPDLVYIAHHMPVTDDNRANYCVAVDRLADLIAAAKAKVREL